MFFHKKTEYSYDPEIEEAVMRCSICTGEQSAGFRNKCNGTFHEIMLIRNPGDLEHFKKEYNLNEVKKIY